MYEGEALGSTSPFTFSKTAFRTLMALPSFHPGLCRSVVPTVLIMRLDFDVVALSHTLVELCRGRNNIHLKRPPDGLQKNKL